MSNDLIIDITSGLSTEVTVTHHICNIIDTPRALTVSLLIKYEEWQQLVDLSIDPCNYEDHSNFADDYLVTEILSKSANLPLGIDKKQVALDSFYESEKSCSKINASSTHLIMQPGIHDITRKLETIMGPLGGPELEFIQERFRFGPGATTGVKGRGCVLSDKYDAELHLTHELIPFYKAILGDRWWEHQRNPVIVQGSKFTTVPKNAKTDRGIAIEPTLNIYGQLGIGALIRRRLKLFGVDLNTQERNQRLASIAASEKLATIDLKAASDSISWNVVMSLLPPRWFALLSLFRSENITVDGEVIELEKFSSMGNGFTFELESLIFTSVVHSIVPSDELHLTAIYGDDLICPQKYASQLINLLETLGFQTNEKKSFLAGRFFESCGTDWFDNQPVRPFYLRRSTMQGIPYTLQIANALRNYSHMRMGSFGCDGRFRKLWVSLYKASPKEWRKCKVPSTMGDVGFIVSRREATLSKARGQLQGVTTLSMSAKPVYTRKSTVGLLLSNLARAVIPIPTYGREPKRGYLGNYRPRRSVVFQWTEEYSWIE